MYKQEIEKPSVKTTLLEALIDSDWDQARKLVDNGTEINVSDKRGKTR